MWSADGRSLFYMSDRSGTQNIWTLALGGAAKQVTRFTDGRVLWPTISYDGRTIVFERDFEVWKLDTGNGQSSKIPITKRGVPSSAATEHVTLNNQFQDLSLSPDGRKVVFVARGEIWAASARDGGDAVRVTRSYARESQIEWTPDSRRIVYVSERDAVPHVFLYDFTTSRETQLTSGAVGDAAPRVSPDGKSVAFVRDGKDLRVLDLAAKTERSLATGFLSRADRGVAWSPDGRWVAYLGLSARVVPQRLRRSRRRRRQPRGQRAAERQRQQHLVEPRRHLHPLQHEPADRRGAGRARRSHPADAEVPRGPLPRSLQGTSRRRPRPGRGGAAPERDAEPARDPSTPVDIVFDDIRRRLSLLPVGVDVAAQTISPDGRSLLLTATAEGQQNLYLYSLDELAREPAVARQLTSTAGAKADAQFTPDSREIFYLEQGRITVMPVETRVARPVAVTAELDIDFAQEKMEVFRQAWTYMRDGFYDDKFHGVNWDAVRTQYAPRIAGAQTPAEMRRLLNLMVGELNASHMGVAAGGRGGAGGDGPSVGRLGLRFDRTEYEQAGRLRITEIVPLGPVAITRQAKVGDYLLAVDEVKIEAQTSLDEVLAHSVNRRTALSLSASPAGTDPKEIIVRPVNQATEKNLLYREWVEANRAYVEKASGGRLGYAHMNDMSEAALRRFYTDLDADNRMKDGIVIDVRNNNGGFVNVYAIDVLARRSYLVMTPRGLPAAPARSMLGQRSLELPTILVTNQHSLSDAEDFAEGYRTLKLGKIVGEPTSGWIIYTGSQTLVDGSTIRMPSTRITTIDGKTMELNPRPVDIPVTRPIGESLSGKDSQLDTAVKELLATLTVGSR